MLFQNEKNLKNHHHSSKHPYEENNYRFNFSTRQPKPIERYSGKRSFIVRDIQRTQEQQLSKDEQRKLLEQQYEDAEKVINFLFFFSKAFVFYFRIKARAATAAAATNGESP